MAIDLVTAMRVFCAVVEAGSFAGAADRLDLSRGMATRYVAQLETHLGVRLLHRTTRKVSLSSAGTDHYQRCVQILALVAESESSAAESAAVPRGVVRVTSPSVFGVQHLDRAIGDYVQRYPDVQVDLSLNERLIDLVEEGFDLGVRIARKVDPGLIARPLLNARVVACAAPAYLKKHGAPRKPEDLAGHNCLVFPQMSQRHEWYFKRRGIIATVPVKGNLRANNGLALMGAAIAGLGVIMEPDFLVAEALRQKRLVALLPEWDTMAFTVYLVWPSRRLLPPKVRTFIDFLAERFGPADARPMAFP